MYLLDAEKLKTQQKYYADEPYNFPQLKLCTHVSIRLQ